MARSISQPASLMPLRDRVQSFRDELLSPFDVGSAHMRAASWCLPPSSRFAHGRRQQTILLSSVSSLSSRTDTVDRGTGVTKPESCLIARCSRLTDGNATRAAAATVVERNSSTLHSFPFDPRRLCR